MGTLSIAIGPKLLQGDSNEAEAGNTEHTADSRLRATNLLFETPIIANEKGKFKITDTGSIDITDATDTYESEQSTLDTELERYLIVCFPNPSGHVMWHRSLKRKILDDELIQEIRKIYCQLRPAWRRLVELRGFGSVRLAKASHKSLA